MQIKDNQAMLTLEIEGYEYIFSNDPDEADLIVVQIGIESELNLFSFSGHAIQRTTFYNFAKWLHDCNENDLYQLDEEGPIFRRTLEGISIEFDEDNEDSEQENLTQSFQCNQNALKEAGNNLQEQLVKFPSRLN